MIRYIISQRPDRAGTTVYFIASILIVTSLLIASTVGLSTPNPYRGREHVAVNFFTASVRAGQRVSTDGILNASASTSFGINLPSGGSEYVYAVATGGAEITSHSFSADLSVRTPNTVIVVGHSSDHTASYYSNAIYPIIAGAEFSAKATGIKTYHDVNSTQLNGVIDLSVPSDVILIAAVSSLYNPEVSSVFQVDAVVSNSVVDGVIIASAFFDSGSHSFTISCTEWHTPLAIGAVLYVIPSTTSTGTTGSGNGQPSSGIFFGSLFYFLGITAVVLVVAVSIVYTIRRKSTHSTLHKVQEQREPMADKELSNEAETYRDDTRNKEVQENMNSESGISSGVAGSTMPPVTTCPNCGSRLRVRANYCGYCGSEVRSDQTIGGDG